ncbi:MAG TPA: hypothetical protein VMN39_11540, partial [Longimicrobiaceae bacterium]|nr:hypothetical protein [Longimicrobiaceae bacterium]
GMSIFERLSALLVFALWLGIFAGGIIVDTRPYRVAISSGGVTALEAPATEEAAGAAATASPTATAPNVPGLLESWIVVLLWFLPLNLALLCTAAGVLGAYGNRANLHDDETRRPPADVSNPYISALLRGFFVYLIMISGLLLLDDAPFSNPTPGQYIRLAGLMSLFSFVVNYNPTVFSRLLMIAADRIQRGQRTEGTQQGGEIEIERAALEVTRIHSTSEGSGQDHQEGQRPDAISLQGVEIRMQTESASSDGGGAGR